jgi:hypothetical protein
VLTACSAPNFAHVAQGALDMYRCASFFFFFFFFSIPPLILSHFADRLLVDGGRAVVGRSDVGASFFFLIFVPMVIMVAVMMTMTGATTPVTLKVNGTSACATIDSKSFRVYSHCSSEGFFGA